MKIVSIPLSVSQVYLLPCRGGYLQVDTGYERDYPRYRKNLAKAGIKISAVKFVLLTHHHDDHAGFLNEMVRDSAARIIAHREAGKLLSAGKNDTSRGGGYVNRFIKFAAGVKMRLDPHWTLTFPPFLVREEDILVEGDEDRILRQLGIGGRLLYTPGHCIDHISLVLDTGEVFCGDAASSYLLFAGLRYSTLFMTDMEESYRSWQKLLDAGGKQVYPAHGRPFSAKKLRENMGKIQTRQLVKFF